MSEGDVSLIQDEDVLRRMWQQTDDMVKRKEIRAHMYKLREERLKTLYAEPTQAESKGFTTSGGHTDSFADQCFQSIKSKEVRDSESPTRDYHYKVQGAEGTDAGWTVVSKNEVSDGGNTETQTTVAHTSGTTEIEGGNKSYAALNEDQKTVSHFEDDNSKFFSTGESSKTEAREQLVKDTGDGTVTSSTTSSVGSSRKQTSYSSKYESNDDDNGRDVPDFSSDLRSIDDVSNIKTIRSGKETSNVHNSENVVRSKTTSSKSTTSKDMSHMIGEGELVSRQVEHPDEFTKVVTETRKLPDGTMVTSTSRETRGSYTSKSGKQTSDHYDSSTAARVSKSEQVTNRQLKSHIDSESKIVSSDKHAERKIEAHYDDDDVSDRRSVHKTVISEIDDVSTNDNVENVRNNRVVDQMRNISVVTNESQVDDRTTRDFDTRNDDVDYKRNVKTVEEVHVSNIRSDVNDTADDVRKVRNEYVQDYCPPEETERPYEKNDVPKQNAFESSGDIINKTTTTGEYTTTYQTDYTSKKISEDLSPTHNAWASSLRSSPDNPLHSGTPRGSVRSFKTSTSSLRSSISPDKKFSRDSPTRRSERTPSPKKMTSPSRISSERETTITKNYKDEKTHHNNVNQTKRDYSPEKVDKYYTKTDKVSSPARDTSPNKYSQPSPKGSTVRDTSPKKYSQPSPKTSTVRDTSPNKYYQPSPKNSTIRDTSPNKYSQPSPKGTTGRDTSPNKYSQPSPKGTTVRDTSPNKYYQPSPKSSTVRDTSPNKYSHPSPKSPARSPVRSNQNGYSPLDKPKRVSDSKSPSTSPTRPVKEPIRSTPKENKFVSPFASPVRSPNKSPNVTPRGSPSISPTRSCSPRKPSKGSISPTRNVKEYVSTDIRTTETKSTFRSRDSSPTTSVSEIEFISGSKKSTKTTDSKYDTTEKIDTSDSVRKSSLKKSSLTSTDTFTKSDRLKAKETLEDDSDKAFENHHVVKKDKADYYDTTKTKDENTRTKSPYVRSETYEERCRKILGMPDKKTLVEGAEKNLSEILGNLEGNNLSAKIQDNRDSSPDSYPSRELTTNVKSAEVITNSENRTTRKSSLKKNTDEQVMNLVDAELIKIDDRGNVVTDDTTEKMLMMNNETNKKISRQNENTFNSANLMNEERVQEQRTRRLSPTKTPVEPEKKDISSPTKKRPEPSNTTSIDTRKSSVTSTTKEIVDVNRKLSNTVSTNKNVEILSQTKGNIPSNKPVKDINNIRPTSRSPSPKKEAYTKYEPIKSSTPGSLEKDTKVNDKKPTSNLPRSSSPQKPNLRNKSPVKIDQSDSVVTKTTKTTKDQNESLTTEKKTLVSDKKQIFTKVNKTTENKLTGVNKKEPSRTLMNSQKYNIFKDEKVMNNKNNEETLKKKDTTKTVIHRNVSEKISNVQAKVLNKFEKDTNKYEKTVPEVSQNKKREIRKKSIEDHKIVQTAKIQQSLNDIKTRTKIQPEMKITRAASDITMKVSRPEPTRVKSKPEINISKITNTKIANNINRNTITTHRTNVTTTVTKTNTKSNLKTKTLKDKNDSNVIIEYQRAVSSRESSPDQICPLPVSNEDDKSKPRYAYKVTEPDDYNVTKKRVHETISESDSVEENRIVELSDSEDETYRPKYDESHMSVTEKVTKFSKTDNVRETTPNTTDIKRHKKIVTDEVEGNLKSDDCLLSVSDKVTKFANVSDTRKSKTHHEKVVTNDFLKHEISDDLKNDECLLSVNDKVSRFLHTADKVTEPIHLSQKPSKTPKITTNIVDKNKKIITDKIAKQSVDYSPKIKTPEKSPELVSKASKMVSEVKNKFENIENTTVDIQLNVQKETIASQARRSSTENKYVHVRSQTTPDRFSKSPSPERTPVKQVPILKNADNVKKAKALFENIASKKPESPHLEPSDKRPAKLTDIGVFKKSPTVESVPDVVPKKEPDDSSACTESDGEVETLERRRSSKEVIHSTKTSSTNKTTNQTFGRDTIDKHYNVKSTPKTVHKEPQSQNTEISTEDFVSTRRGSGKFGVELRRTSTEQSFVTEKKRTSVTDSHSQQTIEEIQDLYVLEQMLEKVTGYEQRRRIRSQIRIVKKNLENLGKSHAFDSVKTKQTSHDKKQTIVENRKPSPVRIKDRQETSPSRKSSQQYTSTTTIETNIRSSSPSKKSKTQSPDRKRSESPTKKVSDTFSTKNIEHTEKSSKVKSYTGQDISSETYTTTKDERTSSPTRSRTSRVSEYTTAYLRKIGASNNLKSEYLPKVPSITKKEKIENLDNHTNSFEKTSYTTEKNISYSKKTDTENEYISRTPSPKRSLTPNERLHTRTPSPDFKRTKNHEDTSKTEYQSVFTNFKTKLSSKDLFNKQTKQKVVEEKPEWATNNILRKTSTNTTKVYTTKKVDDKNKTIKRSQSPSKAIRKPTDVITSCYGVGPTDEDGKPLFGIKALRKHSNSVQNYEVKGTVVTKEFHSVNGGAPEGNVTVTAYSSNPDDLINVIDKIESRGAKVSSDVKRSLQDKTARKGVSSVTSTTRYGSSTGNQVSKIHKSNQPKAIEAPRGQPPAGRRGSVKCLTEKFIKNAVETSKTEKSTYPKAGLILRTSSFKDNASGASSRSSTPGVVRTDSNTSVNSNEANTSRVERQEHYESHRSFLDNRSKVTGVQDVLSRMKNADIVIEDGDTMEDAEARALLNKFLGATVLMHGMGGYADDKAQTKEYKQETRTVVTKSSTVSTDIDDIWDERILRKLLEESDDYEERRRLRARLRQVMAEQEACAQIVADAAESAGRLRESLDPEVEQEQHNDGESLPEPLLRDVHGALSRLQGALKAGPAPAPRGTALLDLVARLQAGLLAQEPPRPPRRKHKNRHTVGVTREELADARKLMTGIAFPDASVVANSVGHESVESKPSSPQLPPNEMPYVLQKQTSFSSVVPPSSDKLSSAPQTPVKNNTPRPFMLNFQSQRSLDSNQDQTAFHHDAVSVQQKSYPNKQQASVVQRPQLKESVSVDSSQDEVAKIVQESLIKAALKKTEQKIVSPEPEASDTDESECSTVKMEETLSDDGRNTPVVNARMALPTQNDIRRQFQQQQQQQHQKIQQQYQQQLQLQQQQLQQQQLQQQQLQQQQQQQQRIQQQQQHFQPHFQPQQQLPVKQYSALPNGVQSNGILKSRDLNKFIVERNRANEVEPPSNPKTMSKQSKKLIMKRANTIDIPKPFHCYQNESDDDSDASSSYYSRTGEVKPSIPSFQPKTDNDKKFLAFIQKHNNDNNSTNGSLWGQNNTQRNGGCNWKSCFGSIKNVFESTNAESDTRPPSVTSAKNFWKSANEPVNFSQPKSTPQKIKYGSNIINSFTDNKKAQPKLPWASPSDSKDEVVTGSLTVSAPKMTNGGGVSEKVLKLIPKPAPVNQFSHAPMSVFKPLPKKAVPSSPVPVSPQVWSPPSVSGRVKHLAEKEFSKVDKPETVIDKNNVTINKPPIQKYISPTQASPISSTPPWSANVTKENKVLNLVTNKLDKSSPISPQSPNTPIKEKPFNHVPLQNGQSLATKRMSLPQALPASGPLSAPNLVKKLENLKQQIDKENEANEQLAKIDAEKLQIEFYEKQVKENSRKFPSPKSVVPITRRFSEHIPDNYTYTVTDFTPSTPISTFAPLPQIPDIEETRPQPLKKLPDLVLNNHIPQTINRPPVIPAEAPKIEKAENDLKTKMPLNDIIKPQTDDDSLTQTEYKAVAKVMKAPVPQQVTVKTNNKQESYEKRDNAAKSLKGVLQKFSSPKHDVISQIEKKKALQEGKPQPPQNIPKQQVADTNHTQKSVSTIETTKTQKISTVTSKVSEGTAKAAKPVSPFAKFRQLDRQNSSPSSPNSPKTPLTPTGGNTSLFKFTDPQLQASASNIKERLLQWCRDKTQEYENVKLDNFSTSWSDGLAFCALIHHFLPDEYDYTKLTPQHRRHNFTLAFKVADEKAGIYPLLDVEDMVTMRKPDWKCVFTYVQAIHRRFKDQD